MSQQPNPGSLQAQTIGCTCPVLDNANGRGWMGCTTVFVINLNCPLHGSAVKS